VAHRDTPSPADVLRIAATGRAGASLQQQVLHDLLEAGRPCTSRQVVDELRARAGVAGDCDLARVRTRLAALGGRLAVAGDERYPSLLDDAWPELGAPVWLFVAGVRPPVERRPAVAIVGTRSPSLDGAGTAHRLGAALAEAGVVVVSGLARGIDQAAHRGALEVGGCTVAVLGTGLGVDYPARTSSLRDAIAASGALLTELLPGAGPRPWQFLQRNRIISGLADATVVVEGRETSGALQTARLAAGQGRDVWAVPGSINAPTSAAPLALLRDGARPLTSIDELVASVAATVGHGSRADGPVPTTTLSPSARTVLGLLGPVPASTDALVAAGTLPAPAVMVAVAELVDLGLGAVTANGVVRV
jgi:DNA processing protein